MKQSNRFSPVAQLRILSLNLRRTPERSIKKKRHHSYFFSSLKYSPLFLLSFFYSLLHCLVSRKSFHENMVVWSLDNWKEIFDVLKDVGSLHAMNMKIDFHCRLHD